jgi:hypothetical protein
MSAPIVSRFALDTSPASGGRNQSRSRFFPRLRGKWPEGPMGG